MIILLDVRIPENLGAEDEMENALNDDGLFCDLATTIGDAVRDFVSGGLRLEHPVRWLDVRVEAGRIEPVA